VGEALAKLYAFRHLAAEPRDRLAGLCALRTLGSGDTVVRAGEVGNAFYLVLAGKARTTVAGQGPASSPRLYNPGDTFGHHALIESAPWPETIRADVGLTLAVLARTDFDALVATLPAAEGTLLRQRLGRQQDFEFLGRLNVFAHLDVDAAERLFDRLGRVSIARGDRLYSENAPSDICYIVRRGRLRLVTTVHQSRRQLAMRGDGDLIGEIELLYGSPRMADAIADTDCELFTLSRGLFDELTPREEDRHALYQLATDRLLQYQNALAGDDSRGSQESLPTFDVGWTPLPGQRYGGSYPYVRAESPVTAGLACLAMIDAAQRRQSGWQARVEQLLWDRAPDTLLSLSRKAEQCGHLSHLVSGGPGTLGQVPLPAVFTEADGSLAVLFRGRRGTLVAANPLTGIRSIDRQTFEADCPGPMLTLSATATDPRLGLVRRFAPYLAGIAVVSLLTQVFGIGGPLAGFWIIDRVLVNGDQSLLTLLLMGVLVMLAFHLAAGALREYLVAHSGGRMTLELQLRFVDHVMRLPPDVTSGFRVGDLAIRFRENEAFVRDAFRAGMFLIVDAVGLSLHLAVLAALSLPLAGVALAFAVSYAAFTAVTASLAHRAGARHLEARKALGSHLIETVAGIHTIKALLLEPLFVARGRFLMAQRKADEFREASLGSGLELAGRLLHTAAAVAILAYGATLTLRGHATTGALFAVLGVFGAMLVPLNGLLRSREALHRTRAAWANLSSILNLETEETESTTVAPVLSGHVEFKHVSFRYPGALEDALTDVNLEVLPGQRVALVGRSGSGKTTLFNLLTGLYRPTHGTIALDEIEIGGFPKSALRRQLGVVEQHPFLFDGTVRENIAKSDPSVPRHAIVDAARAAGAHDFIEALPLGYDTRIGDRGVTLSGGERQRLVIARALVGSPRMLLLDEATSAIDSGLERHIHGQIVDMPGRRTIFLIAHRVSTVRDADVIVVLDQGRIVETGTHGDLMARRGLYCYLNTRFV